MDLNKIPVFAAITKRMHWLNQRQKVLADNIANSDTPGYAPKDLKEINFKRINDQPVSQAHGHVANGPGSRKIVQALD